MLCFILFSFHGFSDGRGLGSYQFLKFEIRLNCLKEAEEEALYADPGCLNGGILCDVTPQFHLLPCLWGDSSAGNDAFGVAGKC